MILQSILGNHWQWIQGKKHLTGHDSSKNNARMKVGQVNMDFGIDDIRILS